MTTYEPLDRSLSTLFADDAVAAAPQDLADRIVAATSRLRPRPTWRARLSQAGSGGLSPASANVTGQPAGRAWLFVALALVLAAAVAVAGSFLLNRQPALRGIFEPAGSLTTPATLALGRPNGQVLIFGGRATAENGLGSLGAFPESILLFDPATQTSREIGATAAGVSFAVPLADGRVLAIELEVPAPGSGGGSSGASAAELINPISGQVTPIGLTTQRHLFGAGVQLGRFQYQDGAWARSGQVLLVGEAAGTTEAELFHPTTGAFSATGSTSRPMMQPMATLLADGRVLVVGEREPVAELYDPVSGSFSPTGAMSGPREDFTATLLQDGRVLIVGGWATTGRVVDGLFTPSEPARLGTTAEIFDPATGMFTQVGQMVTPRVYHFAVLLEDGRVLIGGGTSSTRADPGSGGIVEPAALMAEIFDPVAGSFSPTGSLSTPRFGAGAVRLLDGRVLVIGSARPSGSGNPTDPFAASSLEVFE